MERELDYKAIGKRVKIARIKADMKQEHVAEKSGLSPTHISNIENNHTKVSLNVLLAIANSLDTSIDFLLSEQYENISLALDNEILRVLKDCDTAKKEKILKIIEII